MRSDTDEALISVIIPVFNTEKRFLDCCFAPFKQNIDGVELIVVDDGSCIKTRSWLDEISKSLGTKSVVIHKDNGGQNSARQFGLNVASGRYILFLDSDDYVVEEAFLKALSLLRRDSPDILGYGTMLIDEDGNEIDTWFQYGKTARLLDPHEAVVASCTLFTQIINRKLLEDCPLVVGPKVGEDLASVTPILARAQTIEILPEAVYCYVQRRTSITHLPSPEHVFDILGAFDGMLDRMQGLKEDYSLEVEWLAVLHILFFGTKRVMDSATKKRSAIRRLRGYVGVRFPRWHDNPYLKSELKTRGANFKIVVEGRWRTYLVARKFCKLADRLRSEGKVEKRRNRGMRIPDSLD